MGLAAWWMSADWRWIVGALLILAPWPWTIIAIKPTNDTLKAIPVEAADGSSRRLLEKWGRLHAVRTALGVAAAVAYLWALN